MKRARATRRTHKQIAANARVADNGMMGQANSIGPCVQHFLPMTETAPITEVSDIVGNLTLPAASTFVLAEGDTAGRMVNIESATPGTPGGTLFQPGTDDWLILYAGRAKYDGQNGGYLSVFVGDETGTGQIKCQPYYATFSHPDTVSRIATPFYAPMGTREADEDYCFAVARRGRMMEHYANGVKTGERDMGVAESGVLANWDNWLPDSKIDLCHGGNGDVVLCRADDTTNASTPATCDYDAASFANAYVRGASGKEWVGLFNPDIGYGAGDYAQDFYLMLFCVFADGCPTDIAEATSWFLEQAPLGNKSLYGGWSVLS